MNFFRKLFNISKKEDKKLQKLKENIYLDNLFVSNFIDKGGRFLYSAERQEVKLNLSKILIENSWDELSLLDKRLFPFVNRTRFKINSKPVLNAPIFIRCEHLIADNGSILFSSKQLKSTKLSEMSKNFIVFATTSQIVRNLRHGLACINANYKHNIPTNISEIKNYKLNSDDHFLNYGNSNSKNLYLLLLEDL